MRAQRAGGVLPVRWLSVTTCVLAAIVLLGAGLRLSAVRLPIIELEGDEYLPAAMSLTWDHLPVRMAQHSAVPAYLIRLSGLLFGRTVFGFRMMSVVAGSATLIVLFLIASRWWGNLAGLVAAGLLAVERYHINISAKAVDLPFDLLFVALAMYSFSRFLHSDRATGHSRARPRWLYATALASGLGFLCKELTALMVPVVFVSLLVAHRQWLRRRETWFALAVFVIVISPDIYSNLTINEFERLDFWSRHQQGASRLGFTISDEIYQNGLYMSYGDQLSRFRSIGFSTTPFYFYFGDVLEQIRASGDNLFIEFPYMNPWLAGLLWCALIGSLVRSGKDTLTIFLLTMFIIVFCAFMLVRLGPPNRVLPTDSDALWYWADRTMLPALLLAGYHVSAFVRRWTSDLPMPVGGHQAGVTVNASR